MSKVQEVGIGISLGIDKEDHINTPDILSSLLTQSVVELWFIALGTLMDTWILVNTYQVSQ